MPKTNNSDLYRGSFLSKVCGFISFALLIFGFFQLISFNFLGISSIVLSIVTAYIAYRLAGGRQNPAILADKDLYYLLKHVAMSGKAKIGFHSFRDQKPLLTKLESIGIRKEPTQDTRQFIRDKILTDQRAFDILRDDIIIEMIYNGKEWFWDGYGKKKTAQFFHQAEIIFDLKSSVDYIFSRVFEGLKSEDSIGNAG